MAACGGGGTKTTPPATPAKVVLAGPGSATIVSLAPGETAQLTVVAQDSSGNTLANETFTFQVANATAGDTQTYVTVSNGGLACAGTWDSLSTPIVCTPSTGVGQANVTATALSVVSAPVQFFVHRRVDNISVSCVPTDTQPCPDPAKPETLLTSCLSQTQTRQYTAKAMAQGVDITSTLGTFTWVVQGAAAKVTDNTNGVFTAQTPGLAQIYASSSNVQSTPAPFATCPINKISLHAANGTETSVTLEKSGTKTLAADTTDSKGQPVTGVTLSYGSSQPLIVGGSASLTGASAGTATVTASCTPPACNTGLPGTGVYSNAFVANVNGTTAATTVYVGSTQGTTLVPVPSDTNTPGTAITLGDKPNSMLFNHRGTILYIGTATGLIQLTASSNAVTAPTSQVPGKVLAISPDDNTVLTSDGSFVYAFLPNATTNQVTKLTIPGATAANFSPDSLKAYIVGNGNWTSWTPSATPIPAGVGGAANDVDFIATGAFGYIAGSGSGVGVRATCNDATESNVGTSGVPTNIRTLPDGQHLLALVPPNIDVITATSDNVGCPPDVGNAASATSLNPTPFGSPSGFTAPQLIVTTDGTKAFVTSDLAGKLVGFDVVNRKSAPLQLVGGVTQTFTGGATVDGKLLYVGAGGTNTLHKVDLTTGADVAQIPMSFVPDMVAVQPK
jgi:trimeric autotransporter adhesin